MDCERLADQECQCFCAGVGALVGVLVGVSNATVAPGRDWAPRGSDKASPSSAGRGNGAPVIGRARAVGRRTDR